MRVSKMIAAAIFITLSIPYPVHSQAPPSPLKSIVKEADNQKGEHSHDNLGRGTPFGTVLGFIRAMERDDTDRAVEYLDAQQVPKRSQKLVEDLAAVLDAADLADLSRGQEGDLNDGLPPDRERVGILKTASGTREISLVRVQRGKDLTIWLFSSDTLKWVPQVRGELTASLLERYLSGTFLDTKVYGFALWRLIGIILVLPVSYAIARLLTFLVLRCIPPLFLRIGKRTVDYPVSKLKWPINLLAMAFIFYVISVIAFSAVSRVFWGYVAATVGTIAFTWMGLRLIDDVARLVMGAQRTGAGSGGIAMQRLMTRITKFLVVLVCAAVLLFIAGVNPTAMLTGVGIGGIAVALAAQKTLENFFGAMTIISDKPIRVGDFCHAGEFMGTVEDIGMRSTRIRTVGRTVVSIPNGQLITMSLENFSLRDKFLFNHRIYLNYETTPDQLRSCISRIRTLLSKHPKLETSARVNLSSFRDNSIELEVFAYIVESSYDTALAIQEELLFQVMDIVRESGARFAFPQAVQPPAERRTANR